jgi:hypothetical protein
MLLMRRLIILPVVLGLGACTGFATPNTSNPDRFSLEASAVAHLRGPQTVKITNAYPGPAVVQFRVGRVTLDQDQHQYTDTAIVMLSRALEKHGIGKSEDAGKAVELRVRLAGGRVGGRVISPEYHGRVVIEAQFGDGTATLHPGSDMSPGGWARAFDAAIVVALRGLVAEEKFVAYMND